MASIAPSNHPLSPTGEFEIRTAIEDDAPRVLECANSVFETSPYVLTSPGEFTMTLEQERAFIGSLREHPRQIFLIAQHDARVVGILTLTQNTSKRKLRHCVTLGMSVLETYRGRRVGSAMMRVAMEWARSNPELRLVTLGVYAVNEPGLALYRRFGFVEHGRLAGNLMHDDGSTWENIDMHAKV